MKSKTDKLSLNLVLTSSLPAASIPASAITRDTDQPIHIESGQQSLGMQSNMVTFTGNVVVTQDTVKINANKVIVTRPGGEQGKEVIDGHGKPAMFCQIQDNGKPVEGHASQIHYKLTKNFVVLTGDAYLQQVGSNIKGNKIIYLAKEQKMQTFSDKGRHITIVLVPSQLQDKNNEGQTPAQKKGN